MSNYNYPGHYQDQALYKTFIRERDTYTCQLCGAHPAFDVDHIIPYHISKDNSESNLRVLCHRCNLIGRRYTLPEGRMRRIPADQWEDYIKQELANSASQKEMRCQ